MSNILLLTRWWEDIYKHHPYHLNSQGSWVTRVDKNNRRFSLIIQKCLIIHLLDTIDFVSGYSKIRIVFPPISCHLLPPWSGMVVLGEMGSSRDGECWPGSVCQWSQWTQVDLALLSVVTSHHVQLETETDVVVKDTRSNNVDIVPLVSFESLRNRWESWFKSLNWWTLFSML